MRRILVLVVTAALAAACGGSSDPEPPPAEPPPPPPRTASPVPAGGAPLPVTSFGQTVPAQDGLGEVFPGQANSWALSVDFSLAQGWGNEYSSALVLFVGEPTAPASHGSLTTDVTTGALEPFPGDQEVDAVTLLTPVFSSGDGVRTADVSDGLALGLPALGGAASAYLNGTGDSRLSRALTLSAGASYTLSWVDAGLLRAGGLVGEAAAPYAPSYRVVVRDPSTGAELQELFSAAIDFGAQGIPLPHEVALAPGLPGEVRLSFELRSAAGGLAAVDNVVLSDAGGAVEGASWDFEAGLEAWTPNAGAEVRNLRSAARTLSLPGGATLSVTRTFYAPPAATFGRVVDVFENPGAAPVATSAVYLTTLAGAAPLAAIVGGGAAVVGWDGAAASRDVGLVHGEGKAYVAAGSGDVFVVHPLTVPAGGKVAVSQFVVQLGTSEGGATTASPPAQVVAEAQAIAAGFPAGVERYVVDLEPGVQALVSNL